MTRILRRRGLRAALAVAALGTAALMLGSTPALAAAHTATSGATGTAATAMAAASTNQDDVIPVFLADGTLFGYAVDDPATGQLVLISSAGTILGIVEEENGAVVLIGASGAVLGTFTVDEATGEVIFIPA
jgi:hypothetical protein